MDFISTNVLELENLNPFKKIGKDWMLITSGNSEKYNTMTASWGNLGVLWNKDVATAFIRPQRYTFDFVEKNDYYTLSFFGSEYRNELVFCGRNSGRDVDKVVKTGLTPIFDRPAPYFQESELVFVCKKIYSDDIRPERFIDENIEQNYELNDYHRFYVGEIVECLVKKR